jgi:hypothetical protein
MRSCPCPCHSSVALGLLWPSVTKDHGQN